MRVEVPDRLKPDFHALASILGDLFPTGQVILGGGMLLESSWDQPLFHQASAPLAVRALSPKPGRSQGVCSL